MSVSALGGVTILSVNVNPQVTSASGSQDIGRRWTNQLRKYVGEAGVRTRARLLAHSMLTWFKDVSGGELHEGNVVMEESLEGVRWQLVADYYLQGKSGAVASSERQERESKLRQYSLLSKAICITTDDYLNREKIKIGFPENDLWGVEVTSVSEMRSKGFSYSNGVRVVFGRHYIAHNRSPLNVNSRNRMQELSRQVKRIREVLANNEHAIDRGDWGTVRRNKEDMSSFVNMLRQDTQFNLPEEFRKDWIGKLGNSMESAARSGAFKLFTALIVACCALIRTCYMTRKTFLELREITDKRPSVTVFRERTAGFKFGEEYEIEELLTETKDAFRAVVERAQNVTDLEHAYLMTMDDSTSGIFRIPVRRFKAGDLYKITMEKLSKTNLKFNDDECVAFGKDVVSIKVMGKRVIRTNEEQMFEAAEAFGYIRYLGSTYSKASVMLAILNIIKASGCGGKVFDTFVFHKVWDDICTVACFEPSQFDELILEYFPRKISLCNAITRMKPTCLYPSATYLAMVTKARMQRPTVRRDNACWLVETTEVRTTEDEESGQIVADEPLYLPHLTVSKYGGTEAIEICGSWYQVERDSESPLLHIAGRREAPANDEEVEEKVIHGALLAGEAEKI